MPKNLARSGQRSRKFFNRAGNLRRIRGLNYWPLKKVLREKYRFTETEAHAFADFLLPMLHWDPEKRASAWTMLDHPWLTMPANYKTKLSNEEY
jgi:serine/threonine-protein kinase SRPK3